MPETGHPSWPPGPWFSQPGAISAGESAATADNIDAPFIASVTQVFDPTLDGPAAVSQLAVEVLEKSSNQNARVSHLAIEALRTYTTSVNAGVSQFAVEVLGKSAYFMSAPFIPSTTTVYPIVSVFDNSVSFGPGNGGEIYDIQLAPTGTSVAATLSANFSTTSSVLHLSGDSGLPTTGGFCLKINSEVVYVKKFSSGVYTVVGRSKSNTTLASHSNGASATWYDFYDMAIVSNIILGKDFTADVNSTGSALYRGFLVCFDSTQAYIASNRYPMHVTSFLGVFDAGAGSGGTNRCDAAQSAIIYTPATTSDDCPVSLGNPSRITTNIAVGDVALVRYTNSEASTMTLGSRACLLQSWFGLERVDAANVSDMTNPSATVIDGPGVNTEFHNPSSIGINPSTGSSTATNVPYTTSTLLGSTRAFTHGGSPSPPNFNDKGWPFAALAVRNGNRRIPYWQSWNYHNFSYVYTGFAVDATFCQVVVNRNLGNAADIGLPNSSDFTGPNAVWDDGSYYFGVCLYVAIYDTPTLVIGGPLNGVIAGFDESVFPTVTFPLSPASPVITNPTTFIEGGSGGGINPSFPTRFTAEML